jgi:PA14 domain
VELPVERSSYWNRIVRQVRGTDRPSRKSGASRWFRPQLVCLEDRTLLSSSVVYDFRADLQPTTPKTGWQYLWNANGPIGNASNYVPLGATPPGSNFFGNLPYYTRDGSPALPRAEPAAYVHFGLEAPNPADPSHPNLDPGGHPGRGSSQDPNGIERYAIASATLPSGGSTVLLGSLSTRYGNSTDGIHARVFINNGDTGINVDVPALSTKSFQFQLGTLNAGDRIYVAIGAKASDFGDTFALSYQILQSPSPLPPDPGLAIVPASLLFTNSSLTSPGLIGSYVNTSLRNAANSLTDWRQTQLIAGTRSDSTVGFFQNTWGSRASVGVTGGASDNDWDNFSVQWDGFVQVPADGTCLYTASDDGSRMWIDVNGDNSFDNSATELVSNNWGNSHATGTVAGPSSVPLAAGKYWIRLQYEEGGGGNQMFLLMGNRPEVAGLTPVPTTLLSLDAGRTNPGLQGTYINRSLRGYSPQDDWRQTQVVAGIRIDLAINFAGDSFGTRSTVGITGGTDANWENFSVQWDGFLTIPEDGIRVYTRSDDGSRMWIDVNGDGLFASASPEFVSNNWGSGQAATTGPASVPLSKGTYRIRIQYEEGNLTNCVYLLMGAPTPTNVRATVTGTQAIPVVNPSFESQALGDGAWIDGTLSGWTVGGTFAGPQNWLDPDFAGATDRDPILSSVPDGQNSAFSRGPTISQTLTTTLAANTQYLLQVNVGHRANGAFPGYRVQLWAGGVLLAEDNNSLPVGLGQFVTSTVSYTTDSTPAQFGQPLQIRLVAPGVTDPTGFTQAVFDNVRLSRSVNGGTGDNLPSITVTWDDVINAGNYILERAASPSGPYKQVAILTAETTTCIDHGAHLNIGTTYYYRVRTIAGGISSDESQAASATPALITVPHVVVPLRQYDSPWGDKTYAGTDKLIKELGCGLTALSMALNYVGVTNDPDTLNTLMMTPDSDGRLGYVAGADGVAQYVDWERATSTAAQTARMDRAHASPSP